MEAGERAVMQHQRLAVSEALPQETEVIQAVREIKIRGYFFDFLRV